jgi:periplasmic copper chaperone A
MRHLTLILIFSLSWLIAPNLYANPAVNIADAWVRAMPPNMTLTAAYMQLHNSSDEDIAIIGGSSNAFAQFELHKTIFEGEFAKMVAQSEINIPAHATVELKPGDFHIMLIDRQIPLNIGDVVEITLQFSDDSSRTISAEVKTAEMPTMHHKH